MAEVRGGRDDRAALGLVSAFGPAAPGLGLNVLEWAGGWKLCNGFCCRSVETPNGWWPERGGWGYAETVNLQVGCVPGELVSGRTKVVNPCILAGPEDNARGGRR